VREMLNIVDCQPYVASKSFCPQQLPPSRWKGRRHHHTKHCRGGVMYGPICIIIIIIIIIIM